MFHVFTSDGRTLYQNEDVRECDNWLRGFGYKLHAVEWDTPISPKGAKIDARASAHWQTTFTVEPYHTDLYVRHVID